MKRKQKIEVPVEQGFCPICAESLDYRKGITLDGEYAYFKFVCPKCKAKGREYYYLSFTEQQMG
jgi:transcription initiation factor IIE alpha subunit